MSERGQVGRGEVRLPGCAEVAADLVGEVAVRLPAVATCEPIAWGTTIGGPVAAARPRVGFVQADQSAGAQGLATAHPAHQQHNQEPDNHVCIHWQL